MVNYRRLVALYEQRGVEEAGDLLRESMGYSRDGKRLVDESNRPTGRDVDPRSIDLGRLFEECFGWHEFRSVREGKRLATEVMAERLMEMQGAVTTAAFSNITGQIIYSMTLDAYNDVANVFTQMIPEVPTAFLDGEKVAGVTEIGDEAAVRPEAQPYTLAGVGEDWIFTPPTLDRGFIVPVTWEAIFADRTGLVQERTRDGGKWMGRNREKRAIDAVIDENTTAHRYNWRGTVIATYGNNSGSHTWDNLEATNALVDWTDVNNIEQLANAVTDPYTGEVVDIELKQIIAVTALEQTARRIVRQGSITYTTPGFATSGNVTQAAGDNPYANKYTFVTSKLLAPRLATDTDWFAGDVAKAVKYMQVEKPMSEQAPPNTADEFHRRIVQQFRFHERGAYVVVQPRALFKSTA